MITDILAGAVAGMFALTSMKLPPQTKNQTETAPLVEVMRLAAIDADFRISSQGYRAESEYASAAAALAGAKADLVNR